METAVTKLYEAMFLVDSALAGSDWEGVNAAIESALKRADAEVLMMRKWGEKKLAYDINRKARGTYILCYFRADSSKIRSIERDVQLSERIMRVLILRADKHQAEEIEKDIARQNAPQSGEVAASASPPPVTDQPQGAEDGLK